MRNVVETLVPHRQPISDNPSISGLKAMRSLAQRHSLLGAVSCGVLVLVGPATAQDGLVLDAITVTATKEETRAVDALAGASVVTREAIRSEQPQRIGTILNGLPSVATQENANDPATAVNIRGLQDFGRVAVTIDGARQNFQRSGHNANGAFYLDPAFVRAIDVTRGPVANVYGSGAIGGVVSFRTVNPDDILRPGERAAIALDATGVLGRQSGYFGSAIAAVRANALASALVGLSYRKLDPYRSGGGLRVPDSGQDVLAGLAKVVVEPDDLHRLELSAQRQHFDFANGLGTSTEPRRTSEVTTDNYVGRWSFADPSNPWIDLSASAYLTRTDTAQRRVSGTAAQQTERRSFAIATAGIDIHNTSRFEIGDVRLAITYGVDAFRDDVTTADTANSANLSTPSGERSVYGGFVQAGASWGMFDLIGAVRYDAYSLEGGTNSSDGRRVSPKITLGVRPIEGVQLYGTYAEGYRAPAITETLVEGVHPFPATFRFIPNPNLRPEVGRTLEAGVNLSYDDVIVEGDRLRGKVSIFRNDVDDFIDSIFADPTGRCGDPRFPFACANAFFRYDNVARARIVGAEAELAYDARAWFASVSGAVTRGDNRITREPLTSIYPDTLRLGGGLRFLDEKLTIGARVSFVSAQTRLPASAASLRSQGHTLVDLTASYEISPDARATLSLENIGDVRYRRFRDGADGPGFVAKIGFQTRLGM